MSAFGCNLLERQEWRGQFFSPEEQELRFSGEIRFAPDDGLSLEYFIVGDRVPSASDRLLGVLADGRKCTLIGNFDARTSGDSVQNGMHTRFGTKYFKFLILGEFSDCDPMVSTLQFTIPNGDQYFAELFGSDETQDDRNLFSKEMSFGRFDLFRPATYSIRGESFAASVHSFNDAALDELRCAIKSIESKHPDTGFFIKKFRNAKLVLRFSSNTHLAAAYGYLQRVTSLIALLTHRPVHAKEIQVVLVGASDRPAHLVPATMLDVRTVVLSGEESHSSEMPLAAGKVDFGSLLSNWLLSKHADSIVVWGIQNETGFRDQLALRGEIVLLVTEIEAIAYKFNQPRKLRYQFVLERYSSIYLTESVSSLLGTKDMAESALAIADIRNEISHVGRERAWLEKLSSRALVDLSSCLRILIASFLLRELGIHQSKVDEYQAAIRPRR
jgi:hypothetical protein